MRFVLHTLVKCIPLVSSFTFIRCGRFIACLSFLGLDCLSLGIDLPLTFLTFYTLSIRAASSRISYLFIASATYAYVFAIYLVNGLRPSELLEDPTTLNEVYVPPCRRYSERSGSRNIRRQRKVNLER